VPFTGGSGSPGEDLAATAEAKLGEDALDVVKGSAHFFGFAT